MLYVTVVCELFTTSENHVQTATARRNLTLTIGAIQESLHHRLHKLLFVDLCSIFVSDVLIALSKGSCYVRIFFVCCYSNEEVQALSLIKQ
jgi:hypothetical protein